MIKIHSRWYKKDQQQREQQEEGRRSGRGMSRFTDHIDRENDDDNDGRNHRNSNDRGIVNLLPDNFNVGSTRAQEQYRCRRK